MQSLKQSRARTIDEYLARVPDPAQRRALAKLREAIHAAAPDLEEYLYYHLPAFRVNGKGVVCFGYAARHCALYPMSSRLIASMAKELSGFETSKGTIRFQPERPLSLALVKKIVRARMAENAERAAARKPAKRIAKETAKRART